MGIFDRWVNGVMGAAYRTATGRSSVFRVTDDGPDNSYGCAEVCAMVVPSDSHDLFQKKKTQESVAAGYPHRKP